MSNQQQEVYETIKWNGWGDYGVEMKLHEKNQFWARHVDGKPIKNLMNFIYNEIKGGKGPIEMPPPTPSITLEAAISMLSKPNLNESFLKELGSALAADQIRTDGLSRITHICGKNYRDLWRVRRGLVERAPDAVVLPNNHSDCVKLVRLAQTHNVVLIPFGGGTNVTGGVECNPFEQKRMNVSVDMRRMNRMIKIDKKSNLATFETGVSGPELDGQLFRYGFMLGHDPDSYTYSTLGGWIGARGSGAMSNQYGDIEQMVVSMKVVTPTGVVETPLTSRVCGVDLNGLFIGSEGAFGIVTEATVKLEPIPEERIYEGYLFPSFEVAFAAFQECNAKGIKPCTLRLYDEDDFRMSTAMSTSSHGFLEKLIGKGFKAFLKNQRGWNLHKVSLVIVGFEGTKKRAAFQRAETAEVFKRHGGLGVGRKAGESWQEKKYDLPYIRDFALGNSFWADVFETSVLYADAIPCWLAVKAAVRKVWEEHGQHGWIGCHTAHQYKFGCCLYFTFASSQGDENDLKVFLEIKTKAMEAMLKYRGNLSHHHGIGYEHVPWMTRYMGPGAMNILFDLKKKVDPKNICNPGKLLPSLPKEGEGEDALAQRQAKELMFDKMGIPGAVKAHL
ncbi:alkyldihydroxyacetonephosphate synthase [Angomonas deanei]|nr:alkyldihydroxyacetonephosphate synthase [Angomonas deanei]|eukprot:EPY35754.1 alkyldihydroxyacetonephosphate synthase [Angomonas deanei]